MTENFQCSLNIRGSYNDRASQQPDAHEFGYRVSASIQAKLIDDKLGIAFGYARLVQPNVAKRLSAYDYVLTGANVGGNATDIDNHGAQYVISYGLALTEFGGPEQRDGWPRVVP